MRFLFVVAFLFIFNSTIAQDVVAPKPDRLGLTIEEFEMAKQYQANKLQSFTFKQYARLARLMSLKLCGYNPFYDIKEISTISDDSIKTIAVNNIRDNIRKTKFTSVKEFTDMTDEIKYLEGRTSQENWELTELQEKASFGQLLELMKLEFDYMLKVIFIYGEQ